MGACVIGLAGSLPGSRIANGVVAGQRISRSDPVFVWRKALATSISGNRVRRAVFSLALPFSRGTFPSGTYFRKATAPPVLAEWKASVDRAPWQTFRRLLKHPDFLGINGPWISSS